MPNFTALHSLQNCQSPYQKMFYEFDSTEYTLTAYNNIFCHVNYAIALWILCHLAVFQPEQQTPFQPMTGSNSPYIAISHVLMTMNDSMKVYRQMFTVWLYRIQVCSCVQIKCLHLYLGNSKLTFIVQYYSILFLKV